jgi:hypothetical protein
MNSLEPYLGTILLEKADWAVQSPVTRRWREHPYAHQDANIPHSVADWPSDTTISSRGISRTIIAHFSIAVKLVVQPGAAWLTKQHKPAIVYYIVERVRPSGLAYKAVLAFGDSSPSAIKRVQHPAAYRRGSPEPSSGQVVSCPWRQRLSTSGAARKDPSGSLAGRSLLPQLENPLSWRSEIDS